MRLGPRNPGHPIRSKLQTRPMSNHAVVKPSARQPCLVRCRLACERDPDWWYVVLAGTLSSTEWQRGPVWGVTKSHQWRYNVISAEQYVSTRDHRYQSGPALPATIHYNTDRALRDSVKAFLNNMDRITGCLLDWIRYRQDSGTGQSSRKTKPTANFALQATYPSASVFKLVTPALLSIWGKIDAKLSFHSTVKPPAFTANVLHQRTINGPGTCL
ncbi:MAG: hypothetical protein Ct9H300mP14_00090 [Gammaproteobacteria bacterium]|nr:MAG: hypothetical protein Ct9H300mP14_00090 [Gammaproteobacteria bacterium]